MHPHSPKNSINIFYYLTFYGKNLHQIRNNSSPFSVVFRLNSTINISNIYIIPLFSVRFRKHTILLINNFYHSLNTIVFLYSFKPTQKRPFKKMILIIFTKDLSISFNILYSNAKTKYHFYSISSS